jgi:hypothetical protein
VSRTRWAMSPPRPLTSFGFCSGVRWLSQSSAYSSTSSGFSSGLKLLVDCANDSWLHRQLPLTDLFIEGMNIVVSSLHTLMLVYALEFFCYAKRISQQILSSMASR